MVLLKTPEFHNTGHAPVYLASQVFGATSYFPELPRQIHREAEGIHLIFTLPLPACLATVIGGIVGTGRPGIEGISIWIHCNIEELLGQHCADKAIYSIIAGGQRQIVVHLCGGIPQPHSRNIPGNDKGTAVRQGLHRGLGGVQIALFKALPQFFRHRKRQTLRLLLQCFKPTCCHCQPPHFTVVVGTTMPVNAAVRASGWPPPSEISASAAVYTSRPCVSYSANAVFGRVKCSSVL